MLLCSLDLFKMMNKHVFHYVGFEMLSKGTIVRSYVKVIFLPISQLIKHHLSFFTWNFRVVVGVHLTQLRLITTGER